MTRPSRSNSGPPESPPIRTQSVTITSGSKSRIFPARTGGCRPSLYPPLCPRQTTQSPRFRSSTSPTSAKGHGPGSTNCTMPASTLRFLPSGFALTSLPLGNTTRKSLPPVVITCPAVSTRPCSLTTTPDPHPMPSVTATVTSKLRAGNFLNATLNFSKLFKILLCERNVSAAKSTCQHEPLDHVAFQKGRGNSKIHRTCNSIYKSGGNPSPVGDHQSACPSSWKRLMALS